MRTLLRRVTLGIGTGTALAATVGCATSLQVPDASGTDAMPQDRDGGDGGQALAPFPLDLNCVAQDGGYCCYLPLCYAVAGRCPDVDAPDSPAEATPAYLDYCERHGPFAPNPEYMSPLSPDTDGNCCYVLPFELAEPGRPFLVEGTLQLAPIATRSDWLAEAAAE